MRYLEEVAHEMNVDTYKGVVRVVTIPTVKLQESHEKMKAVIEDLAKKHEFTKIRMSSYYVDFDMKDTTKSNNNIEMVKTAMNNQIPTRLLEWLRRTAPR